MFIKQSKTWKLFDNTELRIMMLTSNYQIHMKAPETN